MCSLFPVSCFLPLAFLPLCALFYRQLCFLSRVSCFFWSSSTFISGDRKRRNVALNTMISRTQRSEREMRDNQKITCRTKKMKKIRWMKLLANCSPISSKEILVFMIKSAKNIKTRTSSLIHGAPSQVPAICQVNKQKIF